MLEFRLLGPLEIRDGDRVLAPLAPKQRALLAALLLRAGQFVSKQRLIDELWGEEPPATVANSLENQVWRLRQVLGAELLLTRSPGYVLDVAPEQVDVLRFERLFADARGGPPDERARRLREALSLFRGPPLADVADERFAELHAARLEELRLAAEEELADAELELGRHADLVPELEARAREHPYRERVHAQLMLALYRSGRQADALSAYQTARATLMDDLGTEPGDDLRELQRAILRQDDALRAPPQPERAPGPERPAGGRPARKLVTVVSCSVGRDVLAEHRDPERVRDLLDRFAAGARGAVERHGGTIEAGGSETLTAVFGAPAALEDHADRALRAAFDAVAGVPADVRPGVGVATGEALVDPDGPQLAVGEPATLAPGLARAAAPGEIVLAAETYALVRERVTVASRRPVAGATVYRAVGLAAGDDGRALRLDAPMVGRERQLGALRAAYSSAVAARACHLVTVVGTAGVGKSRLVREFGAGLGSAALTIRGRCAPYGEASAFAPLADALGGGALEGGGSVEEAFRAARHALASLARDRPLVAVFEDLHWADATFLDLLEHVVALSRGVPVLVLGTARPELLETRPRWSAGLPNASSVLVDSLSREESLRLVDSLLGESDLPDAVRNHLAGSADGNPLFLEELLGMLVDRDVLRRERGRWTTGELPTLAVPATIQALIAARVDRLAPPARLVLELASVEGRVFEADSLAELAPDEPPLDVQAQLVELVRRDLVQPEGDGDNTFSFRHQLVRDAVYASVPKQARAELHERLAALRAREAGETDDRVGFHRERAHELRAELGRADPPLSDG